MSVRSNYGIFIYHITLAEWLVYLFGNLIRFVTYAIQPTATFLAKA